MTNSPGVVKRPTEIGGEIKQGLFLLFEGLPPTIIESQVISHLHAMEGLGIFMEAWAFVGSRRPLMRTRAAGVCLSEEYSVKIKVFRGFRPALPFSEVLNAILLVRYMRERDTLPDFVHARTEYSTAVAAIAKRATPFNLIWDDRGDSYSEFKSKSIGLPVPLRLLAPFKQAAIKKRLRIAGKRCDAAIFVSKQLERLHGSLISEAKRVVAPCVADESLFYYSEELRAKARTEMGYKSADIVICYVGSTARWQCIDETISLMERAIRSNCCAKALLITPASNHDELMSLCSPETRSRITIESSTLKGINYFLNAADYGVLIRKRNSINWVASPVKYAEYSLAGLTVITTGAVAQVVEFGNKIDNIVSPETFDARSREARKSSVFRDTIAKRSRALLGRKSVMSQMAELYLK
ncbi:MAG: hypothetical protein SWQ30_03945 [Thermodesulfobacteriota bacterium]|nr:hypothetical protein [Thermodesulfobacteriota bacterium]